MSRHRNQITNSSIPSQILPHHSSHGGRDQVNNTNDLNPMIMMSGEEGDPSVASGIDLTGMSHPMYQYDH